MQTIDIERLTCRLGGTLLDLGCGEGRHSIGIHWSRSDVHVVGVDLCQNDVASAQQKANDFFASSPQSTDGTLNWSVANGLTLPFADNTFDAVVCSEVLEHVPDFHGMLIEIRRVLKPDGHLAISVPRYWPEAVCWKLSDAYHEVKGGHVRIFKRKFLQNMVENLGYQLKDSHWAHGLHSPYWWLKCALWDKPNHWLIKQYHRLLVWDLMQRPWLTRRLEKWLDPICGKCVVMYFSPSSLPQTTTAEAH